MKTTVDFIPGQILYLAEQCSDQVQKVKVLNGTFDRVGGDYDNKKSMGFIRIKHLDGPLKGYSMTVSLHDKGMPNWKYDRRPPMFHNTRRQAQKGLKRVREWYKDWSSTFEDYDPLYDY